MRKHNALFESLLNPYRFVMVALLVVFTCSPLLAQVDYLTSDVDTLFGLWYSDSDWGDFDNDNDLDLLMAGYGLGGANGQGFMKFYRNDGNSQFALLNTDLVGVGNGTTRFADLDGDNDLDIFICGQALFGVDTTRVYVNNNGVYVDSGFQFPPRVSSSASFGDYDNDGDLDILLTGGTIDDISIAYIQIFRNEGNFNFTQIDVVTPGIRYGNAEFGDYNNDGWLDIAYAGSAGSSNYVTKILKGSSTGTFTELPLTLLGLRYSRVAWVDADCDGDLDLLVSGSFVNESPSVFKFYRNDGNDVFQDFAQPYVLGERQGDMVFGDLNNDGYADLILNGLITTTSTVANVYLYEPTTGTYVDAQTMIYLKYAAMSLGDYNNDGRLDLSLSGHYEYQNYWNYLYQNSYTVNNTPPTAPTGLSAYVTGNNVILSWDAATDMQTPAEGLTYNLRVGTTPGGNEIVSSMADNATGWRKIARQGNCWTRTFYQLNNLSDGTYYWTVQAIDNTFAGSAFAEQPSFTIGVAVDDDTTIPMPIVSSYPNPFTAATHLNVNLKAAGSLKLEIFNVKGQMVKTLANTSFTIGNHAFTWDGTDENLRKVSAGLYTARLTTTQGTSVKKLMLIK
jgi:hypothetical protein